MAVGTTWEYSEDDHEHVEVTLYGYHCVWCSTELATVR